MASKVRKADNRNGCSVMFSDSREMDDKVKSVRHMDRNQLEGNHLRLHDTANLALLCAVLISTASSFPNLTFNLDSEQTSASETLDRCCVDDTVGLSNAFYRKYINESRSILMTCIVRQS